MKDTLPALEPKFRLAVDLVEGIIVDMITGDADPESMRLGMLVTHPNEWILDMLGLSWTEFPFARTVSEEDAKSIAGEAQNISVDMLNIGYRVDMDGISPTRWVSLAVKELMKPGDATAITQFVPHTAGPPHFFKNGKTSTKGKPLYDSPATYLSKFPSSGTLVVGLVALLAYLRPVDAPKPLLYMVSSSFEHIKGESLVSLALDRITIETGPHPFYLGTLCEYSRALRLLTARFSSLTFRTIDDAGCIHAAEEVLKKCNRKIPSVSSAKPFVGHFASVGPRQVEEVQPYVVVEVEGGLFVSADATDLAMWGDGDHGQKITNTCHCGAKCGLRRRCQIGAGCRMDEGYFCRLDDCDRFTGGHKQCSLGQGCQAHLGHTCACGIFTGASKQCRPGKGCKAQLGHICILEGCGRPTGTSRQCGPGIGCQAQLGHICACGIFTGAYKQCRPGRGCRNK